MSITNLKDAINLTPNFISIDTITKREFEIHKSSLFKRGMPFIIIGILPSFQKNELIDILTKHLGNQKLRVRSHSSIEDYSTNRRYEELTITEYLSKIAEDDFKGYAANNQIGKALLDVLNIELPIFDPKNKFDNPKIWIGSNGTTTPLHRDSTDNFTYNLIGSKKWSLFSIKDSDYLYYEKNIYGIKANPLMEFYTSPVDLGKIDLSSFPLFKNAEKHDIILEAGQVLYLPYGWGHQVENLSTTIMINFWFQLENYIPLILE